MARKYLGGINDVTAADFSAIDAKNFGDYGAYSDSGTVPSTDVDGVYAVVLDYRPKVGTLAVTIDGVAAPLGVWPAVPASAGSASIDYLTGILYFHADNASDPWTAGYSHHGTVLDAGTYNALQAAVDDAVQPPEWGDISGTLADQADLQNALNDKAAAVHTHATSDVTGLDSALSGKQALNSNLTAVAGLATTGLIARTGTGTAAARTITGTGDITVNNGNGVSGNPTISAAANLARLATAQTWTAAQTYNARVHYGGGLSTSSRSINSNTTLALTDYHFTVSLATNSVTITLDTLNAAIGQEYYGEYFNQSSGLGNGYNVTFDAGTGNNIAGNGVYAQTYVGLNSGASRWFRIKKISSTAWSISSGAIQ